MEPNEEPVTYIFNADTVTVLLPRWIVKDSHSWVSFAAAQAK